MKIINNYNDTRTTFADLEVGDVFIDEENDIMIKVEGHGEDSGIAKAVRLCDGDLFSIASTWEVIKVEAILTIGQIGREEN